MNPSSIYTVAGCVVFCQSTHSRGDSHLLPGTNCLITWLRERCTCGSRAFPPLPHSRKRLHFHPINSTFCGRQTAPPSLRSQLHQLLRYIPHLQLYMLKYVTSTILYTHDFPSVHYTFSIVLNYKYKLKLICNSHLALPMNSNLNYSN